MAKKNQYQMAVMRDLARLQKKTHEIVPSVYSAICKVLLEQYEWEVEKIVELFAKSQEIWNESMKVDKDMIRWVEETTGISFTSDKLDKTDDSEYEEVYRA